jgi:hypothetical protein
LCSSLRLLILALVAQGCVPLKAPLQRDAYYPPEWPDISTLGPACHGIAGLYSNEGVLVGRDLSPRSVSLMRLLDLPGEASKAALSVEVRRLEQRGDAFLTLHVDPEGDAAARHDLVNCFCIRQTLACTRIGESYWNLPGVGAGGSQTNVYLSAAVDGSLIARVQGYHADVILAVPMFGKKEPWARFSSTAAPASKPQAVP